MDMLPIKLVVLTLLAGMSIAVADSVLIANPGVAESALTKNQVESMLLGKSKNWPSGSRVKLCIAKSGDASASGIKTYASKTLAQFNLYWRKLAFSGKGKPPNQVGSDADVLAYVAANPGAIGFVTAGQSTDGAKVISIQE